MYGLHFPFPCALAGGLRRMWVGGEERKGMGEVKKGKGQGGGRKDAGGEALGDLGTSLGTLAPTAM